MLKKSSIGRLICGALCFNLDWSHLCSMRVIINTYTHFYFPSLSINPTNLTGASVPFFTFMGKAITKAPHRGILSKFATFSINIFSAPKKVWCTLTIFRSIRWKRINPKGTNTTFKKNFCCFERYRWKNIIVMILLRFIPEFAPTGLNHHAWTSSDRTMLIFKLVTSSALKL